MSSKDEAAEFEQLTRELVQAIKDTLQTKPSIQVQTILDDLHRRKSKSSRTQGHLYSLYDEDAAAIEQLAARLGCSKSRAVAASAHHLLAVIEARNLEPKA